MSGSPGSICNFVCGDGIFVTQEGSCDDGNNLAGDGCDSLCV